MRSFKYLKETDEFFTLNKTYELTRIYSNGDFEFKNDKGNYHIWSKSLMGEYWKEIN